MVWIHLFEFISKSSSYRVSYRKYCELFSTFFSPFKIEKICMNRSIINSLIHILFKSRNEQEIWNIDILC